MGKREKRKILTGHLLPVFGTMMIEALKQTDVDTYSSAELRRGIAVKTVNNRLAVLSTLVKYVTGEKTKLRFTLDGMTGELTAVASEDVERLLAVADDHRYRAVVLLAAEAGLRAGEIRGAQRGDVVDGQLTVRRALDNATNEAIAPKHNKKRTIPLSPRLVRVLESLPRRGLWLVSRRDGGALLYDEMLDAIGSLYEHAGVRRPPKPIHCLRHTFGTVMAKRVPLPVLQKLMGHADVQTTLRYVDVSEDDKREAIAAVFGTAVAATRQRDSEK